ncbi:MAG: hypothetical protein JAZ11_05730 [Candidatus Thiodiazotropha lotti]|nr:hypothetical protein [Candidatus Thiodiazotropha lotti]
MYQAKKEGGAIARFFQANMPVMANQRMILEALLRWQHPYRDIVIPDQFIQVAGQQRRH